MVDTFRKIYDYAGEQYNVETEQNTVGGKILHRQVVATAGSQPIALGDVTMTTDVAGATSSEILAADTARKVLAIFNPSTDPDDVVYIAFGRAATDSDWPIRPGEMFPQAPLQGFVFTQSVEVIRDAGGSDVTLTVVSQ